MLQVTTGCDGFTDCHCLHCHNTGKKDEADGNKKYIGRVKEAGRTRDGTAVLYWLIWSNLG